MTHVTSERLTGSAQSDTTFHAREVPWIKSGTTVQDALTAEDAIRAAGMDWQVIPESIFCHERPVPNRYGLVRQDTGDALGIVSGSYHPVQNREVFEFADQLVGTEIQYESGGSIKGGQRIFLTAKWQKQWTVAEDGIDLFLLLSNGHTGGDALKIACTPVRISCQNMLSTALRKSRRVWSFRHTRNVFEQISQAKTTLCLAKAYMEEFEEWGNRTVDTRVTPETTEAFVDYLFPKSKTGAKVADTFRDTRIRAFERCLNMEDILKYKDTAWGLLNAVSDYETHVKKWKAQNLMSATIRGKLRLYQKAQEFIASI